MEAVKTETIENTELTIDGLLDSEKKLIRRVTRYIEKHNLKMANFEHLVGKPLFDASKDFPASSTESSSGRYYFDGDSVINIWTEHNNNNRRITTPVIVKYAITILTGGWKDFLPQGGLVFDWNQQGINNQHRLGGLYLASLINPQVKIGFEVGFNADPADIKFYDINRVKTEADLLTVDTKLDNSYEIFKDLDQTRLLALVKQMPMSKKFTQEQRLVFIKAHIQLLIECLDILSDVQILPYDKRWAGIFVEAIIGPDGQGFTNPDGENVALTSLKRFCKNIWKDYEDINKSDPLHLLFKKLVENMNAKKSNRLGKTEIQQMTTYLLRKALMDVSVNGKLGTRTKPKIATFQLEEFEDYRQHGAASQTLKENSVSKRSTRKRN